MSEGDDTSDFSEEEGVETIYFKENCNEIVIDEDQEDPDDDKLHYLCNLCRREFTSVEKLYVHLESELHHENKVKLDKTANLDLSKDESYVEHAKEEEGKWIRENLCADYGYGFPCDKCNIKESENVAVEEKSEEVDKFAEPAEVWDDKELDDWRCPDDPPEMNRIREKIHHPLKVFGTECGVPSEDEELQEEDSLSYTSFGKKYCPKGRRVEILELEPVGKEEQVPRDPDERVTRLPGGWCLFEKKTDSGIRQRVVLVTSYRDMDTGACCPEPRKK